MRSEMSAGLLCIAVIGCLMLLASFAEAQHKSFEENQVAIGSNPASNTRHVDRVVTSSRQVVVTKQRTSQRCQCGCGRKHCRCGK